MRITGAKKIFWVLTIFGVCLHMTEARRKTGKGSFQIFRILFTWPDRPRWGGFQARAPADIFSGGSEF